MSSRLTVVLVSLLLAAPVLTFFLWLMIQPTTEAIACPEECRCERDGYLVDCSNTRLNNIPSILITHVRQLVLDGNNITFLERDNFFSRGLIELEMISAVFCKIRRMKLGAFNGLTKLTYLSLKGNEISEIIPGVFENMNSLEFLYLGNNSIEHLYSEVFSGLVNLKNLSLEGNNLHYVHPDTFLELPNLQLLYLGYNPYLQIPTYRNFINSHSLTYLDISNCSINSLSVETFENVSALEWLALNDNNLRTVDINILRALPKLSTLYLYGNPLHCDFQLQEVWRWCKNRNIQTAYGKTAPECYTPFEVKGMCWEVLETGQYLGGNILHYEFFNNRILLSPFSARGPIYRPHLCLRRMREADVSAHFFQALQ